MGQDMKEENAALTIRINGNGPLGGIVAVSDCEGNVRGYVGNPATELPLRSDGKLNLITSLSGFYSSAHYVVAQPINIGSAARIVGYVFVTTNSATIIDGWRTFVWVFLAASAAVMMIVRIRRSISRLHANGNSQSTIRNS